MSFPPSSLTDSRRCKKTFRQCSNGRCVSNLLWCNGADDCGDGSDEIPCNSECCSRLQSMGAPSNRFRVGALGSEHRLTQCMCSVAEKACSVGEFRCRDGSCISKSSRCNQLVDCEDASDEMNCSECLPYALVKSCAPSRLPPCPLPILLSLS